MGKKAVLLWSDFLFRLVTLVVATLTIIAWAASHISPDASWLPILLALGMTALLLCNFLFAIIWLARLSFWAIVPLAVLALNWSYISSVVQVPLFRDTQPVAAELSVASYNMHGYTHKDFNATLTEILDYFSFEGIDVVCLQEFCLREGGDTLIHQKYPYRVVYSPYISMQLAVYSRYPIESSEFIKFPNTVNGGMVATVDIGERKVLFTNVHMQTTNLNQSKDEIKLIRELGIENPQGKQTMDIVLKRISENAVKRGQQVDIVRDKMDDFDIDDRIVCGDFNDSPATYTYRHMAQGMKDAFRQAGSGYIYTMSDFYRLFRVDYVLYSGGLRAVSALSPRVHWSDHYPVMAGFVFDNK